MDRLLREIRKDFDLTACEEFTVEAGRPDTITLEKLRVMAQNGVDRISINPQTLNNNVLEAIGRAGYSPHFPMPPQCPSACIGSRVGNPPPLANDGNIPPSPWQFASAGPLPLVWKHA